MKNQIVDVAKVMSRGQMVIPKRLREEFNLSERSVVGFIRTSDGILIKPIELSTTDLSTQERWRRLSIKQPTISKEEFLKDVKTESQVRWTKKSDRLLKEDRRKDRQRLIKINKLEPYW